MGHCYDCPHIASTRTAPTRATCCYEDGSRAEAERRYYEAERREWAKKVAATPRNRHERRRAAAIGRTTP
jgi:hypothetical protein